jgi:hypothetical protein
MTRIQLQLRSAPLDAEITLSTHDNSQDSTQREIRQLFDDVLHVHPDVLSHIESMVRDQQKVGSHTQTIVINPPAISKPSSTTHKDPLGVEIIQWLRLHHSVVCKSVDYTGIVNGIEQVINELHELHTDQLNQLQTDMQNQINLLKRRNTQLEQQLIEYNSLSVTHNELNLQYNKLQTLYEQERHAHLQTVQNQDVMVRDYDQIVANLHEKIDRLEDLLESQNSSKASVQEQNPHNTGLII